MTKISELIKEKAKFERKGNIKEVANYCNLLGVKYQEEQNFEDALAQFNEGQKLLSQLNDKIGVAVAHRNIGEVFGEMENFKKAFYHQEKFLNIAYNEGNIVEQQRAHLTIGKTYFSKAEKLPDTAEDCLRKAEDSYQKSLEACQKINGEVDSKELSIMRTRIYHNIGLVLDMKGESNDALKCFNIALELCRNHSSQEDSYRIYCELSKTHLKQELFTKALDEASAALKIANNILKKSDQIDALLLIAQIQLSRKDYEAAKKAYIRAYKCRPNKHDPIREIIESSLKSVISVCRKMSSLAKDNITASERLKCFERLGDLHADLKFYDSSVQYYLKAISLAKQINKEKKYIATIYASLAQTYKDKKDYNQAHEYYIKEIDIRKYLDDKKEIIKTLVLLGVMHQSQRSENYIKYYVDALALAKEIHIPKLVVYALEYLESADDLPPGDKDKYGTEKREFCDIHNIVDSTDIESDANSGDEDSEVDLNNLEFNSDDECSSTSRKRKKDFKEVNSLGEKPLHVACKTGNMLEVKYLIRSGHPINIRDNAGWTPLHESCNFGNLDIVDILVKAGANVNDKGGRECGGVTPLHDAATNLHIDIVKYLIVNGASITAQDNDGKLSIDLLLEALTNTTLESHEVSEVRRFIEFYIDKMRTLGITSGLHKTMYYKLLKVKNSDNFQSDILSIMQENMRLREKSTYHSESSIEEIKRPLTSEEYRHITKKSSVKHDYIEAIKSVGSKSKELTKVRFNNKPSSSALLSSDDIVNDWLINDFEVDKKKKSPSKSERRKSHKIEKRKSSPLLFDQNNVISKKKRRVINNGFSSDDDSLIDKENISMSRKNSFYSHSSPSPRVESPSPLIKTCLSSSPEIISCRSPSPEIFESEPFSSLSFSNNAENVSKNFNTKSQCAYPSSRPEYNCDQLKVRINIQRKNIPIDIPVSCQKKPLRWLEAEIIRLYFNSNEVRASFQLKINDNTVGSNEIISDILLSNNCELKAEIVSIDYMPLLPKRYQEICSLHKIQHSQNILSSFKKAASSTFVDLSKAYIRDELSLECTILCFQYQNIFCIDLSNNKLQKKNLSTLCQSISTVPQLQKLTMKACSLTTDLLLTFINEMIQNESRVKCIDISYNSFYDLPFKSLIQLLNIIGLKEVCIISCKLRFGQEIISSNYALTNKLFLDDNDMLINELLYFSHMPKLSFISFSGCLTSYTDTNDIDNFLSNLFNRENNLIEYVDLSACSLIDAHVETIATYLCTCTNLSSLNISYNDQVNHGITYLLRELSRVDTPITHLNFAGTAVNSDFISILKSWVECRALIKPLLELSFPTCHNSITLVDLWKRIHGAKAVVKMVSINTFLSVLVK